MKFTTVHELRSEEFDKKVNALLRDGWELYGLPHFGLATSQSTFGGGDLRNHTHYSFTQALIKKP